MIRFFLLLLAFLPVTAWALTFAAADQGIAVDAGLTGNFTVYYPTLTDAAGKEPHKIIQKSVRAKSATVSYEGGATVDVAVTDEGVITYQFANVPPDATQWRVQSVLPLTLSQGGKWKIGSAEQPFPPSLTGNGKLFQGQGSAVEITDGQGARVNVEFPPYSYVEMQDNRFWHWPVYMLVAHVQFARGDKANQITLRGTAAAAGNTTLIDALGQIKATDWPDKVKSVDELNADVSAEKEYYASLHPPPGDDFGGLPGSQTALGLKATGFFHVEKTGEQMVSMVDPDGQPLLSTSASASCNPGGRLYHFAHRAANPRTSGNSSSRMAPSSHGLSSPTRAKASSRFTSPTSSASTVNPTRSTSCTRAHDPAPARSSVSIPSAPFRPSRRPSNKALRALRVFPTSRRTPTLAQMVPRSSRIFPACGRLGILTIDANMRQDRASRLRKATVPARADGSAAHRLLHHQRAHRTRTCRKRACPRLKGSQNAVQARARRKCFAKQIRHRRCLQYRMGNEREADLARRSRATRRSSVGHARGLRKTYNEFTGQFFDTYFKLVSRHVPQIRHATTCSSAAALQPGTINNEQLCRAAGKYMDLMSFNYYTNVIDPEFLGRVQRWCGLPMMLSEFFFSSPRDSGLLGGPEVSSQTERGLAYRQYVERAAALGYVVGIEWFTMIDQSSTGRWFEKFSGERANTGLISGADRPWKPMLAEMMKTNDNIYEVELGKQPPFVWDDPRFTLTTGARRTTDAPRAKGPITLDGTATNWPGIPPNLIVGNRLCLGRAADGLEGSFRVCWDDANLYVLVNVKDATPLKNENPPPRLWCGDAVELFLGTEKTDEGGPMQFLDRHLLLGAGAAGNAPFYFSGANEQEACDARVFASSDGYTMEAAIPWKSLGATPHQGQSILFDVGIDDSTDGKDRRAQLMWSGGAKNSSDRTHWGVAKLLN